MSVIKRMGNLVKGLWKVYNSTSDIPEEAINEKKPIETKPKVLAEEKEEEGERWQEEVSQNKIKRTL